MPDSAARYAQACDALAAAGARYTLAEAETWHALVLVALGRFNEAEKKLDGLEQACERVGNPGALFGAKRARGFMDIAATGDLERWNAFAAADLAFLEALRSGYTANSHAYVALGKFWDGRWDEALPHAKKAVELALDDSWVGHDATALLLLHAYRGEADAARALLAAQRPHLPVAGRVCGSGAWELLPAAVETLAVIGDRGAAAELYLAALAAIDAGALIHYAVKSLPETTAGIAAACGGRLDLAETHLRKAVRQAHELPNRLEQPEARRWLAWLLLERGAPADRESARALLAEAAALYAEIGMPKHRERALAMLAAAERL
jgi:tetratricopeptide (TPR) repeat protein